MDLVLSALYCVVLTVSIWTWYELYCSHSVYEPGTNCIVLRCSHSVYGPGTNCIVLTVCIDLVLIVVFSQCVWTWY